MTCGILLRWHDRALRVYWGRFHRRDTKVAFGSWYWWYLQELPSFLRTYSWGNGCEYESRVWYLSQKWRLSWDLMDGNGIWWDRRNSRTIFHWLCPIIVWYFRLFKTQLTIFGLISCWPLLNVCSLIHKHIQYGLFLIFWAHVFPSVRQFWQGPYRYR